MQPSHQESTCWACVADRVFDGEHVLPNHAVVIAGTAIVSVMPAGQLPPEMPVVAAPGGTILPGLIDTHVHFSPWQGSHYLAWGVTTIRDVGNDPAWILAQREEASARPWPSLNVVGPMLDGPTPTWPFARPCRDAADAVQAVRDIAELGVDGIKLYVGLPTDWLPGIVEAARAVELPLMMHCFDAPGALNAGVEEFFHLDGLLDALWPGHPSGWLNLWGHEDFPVQSSELPRMADRIATAGMITTPTLFYLDFRRQMAEGTAPSAVLPEPLVNWLRAFPDHASDLDAAETWTRALRHAQTFLRLLIERGAPILPGTDVPWTLLPPGQALWRELTLLTEVGLSPLEVLAAATSRAADRLRQQAHGRLRPGAAADLVLFHGDPTATISDHPSIIMTIKNGQCHSPEDLTKLPTPPNFEAEPLSQAFRNLAAG